MHHPVHNNVFRGFSLPEIQSPVAAMVFMSEFDCPTRTMTCDPNAKYRYALMLSICQVCVLPSFNLSCLALFCLALLCLVSKTLFSSFNMH